MKKVTVPLNDEKAKLLLSLAKEKERAKPRLCVLLWSNTRCKSRKRKNKEKRALSNS